MHWLLKGLHKRSAPRFEVGVGLYFSISLPTIPLSVPPNHGAINGFRSRTSIFPDSVLFTLQIGTLLYARIAHSS